MASSTTQRPSRLLTEYYGTLFFLLVTGFFAVAGFVLKPMLDVVKSTNAETTATLQTLENERAYLNSLEQSIAAAQHIPKDVLNQVDRALPREADIPELLVLFSSAAIRDNVSMTNVTFAQMPPPQPSRSTSRATSATSTLVEVQSTLSVNAPGYPQIKRFLRDVERSLRIMDVVGLTVTSRGDRPSYVIQLKSYAFPQTPHE